MRNFTKVPDELVMQMIRFAKPPGITGFDIVLKNDGNGYLHGWAYTHGTSYHLRSDGRKVPLVTVHVPRSFGETDTPWIRNRFDPLNRREASDYRRTRMGYLNLDAFTTHENLLHLIAHELRHLWQRHVKGRRVWGARGRFSERDADAYAIGVVRRWRRA